MAAPGGLLLRLWPGLRRGKSLIIFLGLVAFGSMIQRPGLEVGCKWASVGYGPS
jgi:hypothetical protein